MTRVVCLDLPLKTRTPSAWTAVVLADFASFLVDHAACERKAASTCMALVSRYLERPVLVEPLTALAREELEHFQQVYRLMTRRGLMLAPDAKDEYVNSLIAGMRSGRDERLLDQLCVSALIEARSCERFAVLTEALTDPELREFYAGLTRSEAGHARVFVRLAERIFPQTEVDQALDRWLALEDQVTQRLPLRAAVH